MRLENRTATNIWCNKTLVRPQHYSIVYPTPDQKFTIYSGTKYLVVYTDLLYDLNIDTIIIVDSIQNGVKSPGITKDWGSVNKYGVAFMDFENTSFAAGSPLRRVQYDNLKINGQTQNPETLMSPPFWSCQ